MPITELIERTNPPFYDRIFWRYTHRIGDRIHVPQPSGAEREGTVTRRCSGRYLVTFDVSGSDWAWVKNEPDMRR